MKVAVIQMNTKSDKEENLRKAEGFIRQAADNGAELISLPEYFNYMGEESGKIENAEQIPDGRTTSFLSGLAKEYGIFIHAGSIIEKYSNEKSYNTSIIVSPDGKIVGNYRKIHLFDIEINGVSSYMESNSIEGGDSAEIVELPFGKAGMAICYDLRFPELFRKYALEGCNVFFLPAAFTQYTGMLHWETLLRARAIENQCYVIAAGQIGSHLPGKVCYGNSMIIDPWGTVVAKAPEKESIIYAELEGERVQSARESIPCLTHRKPQYY
ncbi:carbon-nitrogen hydrolase family protein [Sporosarcina contaminans]|uniref:Carbon-nitrogen hydrolase family protein n=1 Tax=Sporosarcina contaminans TaxID=633403 RepID=A0ABW3TYY5_9BACL